MQTCIYVPAHNTSTHVYTHTHMHAHTHAHTHNTHNTHTHYIYIYHISIYSQVTADMTDPTKVLKMLGSDK